MKNDELRKFRIRNSEFREMLIAMGEDEEIKNEELRIKKIQNSEFGIQRDVDWDGGGKMWGIMN